MDKYRNRAVLYLTEIVLGVAMALAPVDSMLPMLTIVGLFLHFTYSLGMLPFHWRLAGAGSASLFGIRHDMLFIGIALAGLAAMASWPMFYSKAAYICGLFVAVSAIELLVTKREFG